MPTAYIQTNLTVLETRVCF